MKIATPSHITKNDLLVIPFYEEKNPTPNVKSILGAHSTADFEGKLNESVMLYQRDKLTPRILLVGLGKEKEETTERWRQVGGTIKKNLKPTYRNLAIVPPKEKPELIAAFVEGLLLAHYQYEEFINDPERHLTPLEEINILVQDKKTKEALAPLLNEVRIVTDAVKMVRNMVNAPSNVMSPHTIGQRAKQIARRTFRMGCTVYSQPKLEKMGLNCLVSVGNAAHEETKLVILNYKYKAKNKRPIVLVGKGICFDSGGMNLKTKNLTEMKYDMTGAATVLGVFRILSELKLPLHVIGIAPCAENLIGAKATKPGDVIRAYDGTTVEITNTDAEGRLVLCDAIAYAVKHYNPEAIIDVATLTGAAITALGYDISALMTNHAELSKKIKTAAQQADEKVWELPLEENYKKKIKSPVADVANYTESASAGTIMGGIFLEHFTKGTPWVHLDMGGSAWAVNDDYSYLPKGATGRNIRTLWNFLKNY